MSGEALHACISRRSLVGGAALAWLGAGRVGAQPATPSPPAATAPPAGALNLITYSTRLGARLSDAGGGRFQLDFAGDLLSQVNRFRAALGLADYGWDETLAACARAHAADMLARSYFAHASPEGFTHQDRVSLLGRDFCGDTAENLAWRAHYSGGSTPRQFEDLWENSAAHRDNLLRPDYAQAGYGVVTLGDAWYAAGVYARTSVRLAQPLPISLSDRPQLARALTGSSPAVERLAVTAPFQNPTWTAATVAQIPQLEAGVWQLRPLRAAGGGRYDVLIGPMFFVG